VPYLTPPTIPTAKICRVLRIPDEQAIIAEVTGALQELTFAYNWELYGAITPQQMADAMFNMFDDFCFQDNRCPMLGAIFPFASTDPPPGTLRCDATTYNRVDYPDLYAVLGAAYILNANQFITPDCRAKVVAGSGNYDGTDFILYNFMGESMHVLEEFEMPAHVHSVHDHIPTLALEPGELPVSSPNPIDSTTGSTGNGAAHNNIQPTIVLDYCIVALP